MAAHRGFLVPGRRLLEVLIHTLAPEMHLAQEILGHRIAGIGLGPQVFQRHGEVSLVIGVDAGLQIGAGERDRGAERQSCHQDYGQ
jgi:hypothetical protein